MSAVSLSLDIAGEGWHLDVPANWSTRFQSVFKHLIEPLTPRVRIDVRAAGTVEEVDWATSISSGLPTSDSIASVSRDHEVAHVSRMALEQYDFQKRQGESVLLDSTMEANYLGTNLLLRHIAWRAAQRCLIPIHAAAVGDGERFWLIPAAAGKGKSTTTAAAIAGGLTVLGDDFVLLDPKTRTLYSIYHTVRLQPESRRMIDRHFAADCFVEIGEREDDKQLLIPRSSAGSGRFAKSGMLQGILILEQADQTRIGSCVSPARTLQAFASTLRLLPSLGFPADVAFRAFSGVVGVAGGLEARRFEISSDLSEVATCLQRYVGSGR